MRGAAPDRDDDLPRVEGLGLDLAELGAVERVGVLGAEPLEIDVLRAARDLLVHREADTQRRMLDVGIPLQVGDRRHDLGHARLVVGAEQRGAVGGDDVVADLLREQRQLHRIEHAHRRGEVRSRRRRRPRAPAGRRPCRSRPERCRRGRSARSPAPARRRAATRRRSRTRRAARRPARSARARRGGAGRGRAASRSRARHRRRAPTGCRSGRSGGSGRARPARAQPRAR